MITLNYLANALPINGYTTGDISDILHSKIVPAGFTFSIWGVIYLSLLGTLIHYGYSILKEKVDVVNQYESIVPWFFIANVVNGTWILAWHHIRPGIALLLMIILFICLLKIFLFTHNHKQQSPWKKLSYEIYFGWINIAITANVAAYLTHIAWDGLGISFDWIAIVILLVVIIIGSITIVKYRAYLYALTLAWAMYGISKNISNNTDHQILIAIPLVGLAIFLISGMFYGITSKIKQ